MCIVPVIEATNEKEHSLCEITNQWECAILTTHTQNSFFNNFSQIIAPVLIKFVVLKFQITYNNAGFEVF
jgi:hypothetical protein